MVELKGADYNELLRFQKPRDNTPFPVFGKPAVVGTFSLDSFRKFIPGPVYLKFLKLPDRLDGLHFDLDEINRQQKLKDLDAFDNDMHQQTNELVHLLNWISNEHSSFTKKRPQFVFYRGLMTKILGTPYEMKEGWKLGAMLKNGTIYLRNIDTTEAIENRIRQSQDPRQAKMTSWGYNFEYFLLADSTDSSPNPEVASKNECNLVFQTRLGQHSLLYAAEIDGVWLESNSTLDLKQNPELLNECNLVELKTTRMFPNGKMGWNFRKFNLRKWFCQSYTTGVSYVVAGLRDDNGVVSSLKIFKTKELSDLGNEWSSNVCFKFLEDFLTKVKETVKENENLVYIFEFIPQQSNYQMINIKLTTEKASESEYYLKNIK